MPSIPINNLTNKTDINGQELLPFVRDGKTYRCSVSGLFYNNAITQPAISNGAITPAKLSSGGPSWSGTGAGGVFSVPQTGLEFGTGHAQDFNCFIDLHTAATPTDFETRIVRDGGVNGSFRILNRGTNHMILSTGGNVGIGTATPTAKLHVEGGSVDDSLPELRISGSSGNISSYVSLCAGFYNPIVLNQDKGIIFTGGTVNTGNLVIAPHATSTSGIRMLSSGNVGIGKSTPTTTLDVNGTVTATSFVGTTLSASGNAIAATPTLSSHLTTKEYVDSLATSRLNGVLKLPEKTNSGMIVLSDSFFFMDTNNTVRVIGSTAARFGRDMYAPAMMIGSTDSLYNVSKFYANTDNVFILTNEGNVFGVGKNTSGQLGIGNTTSSTSLKKSIISNCTKIVISPDNNTGTTYFLTNNGAVYATGENSTGQLGRGNTTDASTPILTLGPGNSYGNPTTTVIDIEIIGHVNTHAVIALLSDGTVWCVGYGPSGQMGNGAVLDANKWVQVKLNSTTNLTNITKIYAGGYDVYTSFYALANNGTLYGWGNNHWGQLATGNTTNQSYAKIIETGVSKFWVFGASCFIKKSTDNKIYAWGYNNYGTLGLGDTVDRKAATEVTSLPNSGSNIENLWGSMFDGYPGMGVFAKETGSNTIYATGYNAQGGLGLGDQTTRLNFNKVYFPITSPIIDIICHFDSAAGIFTIILTQDGNIYHSGRARWGIGSPLDTERWLFGKITNNVCG